MQKLFKSRIFVFILGLIVASTTSAFAYSLIASDVGFTPKDSTWEVENTKEALDDLRNHIKCDEWKEITGSTANNASYVYQKMINLYKCGNICKITFALNNVSVNTEYPLITNPKYYPKEVVGLSAIGSGNGYSQGNILTNGNIIVAINYNGGKWTSANNIAFICE